jgi:hypothetical protein
MLLGMKGGCSLLKNHAAGKRFQAKNSKIVSLAAM